MSISTPTVNSIHPASPDPFITCRTANFTTRWPQPSTAVVAVVGELDAANASDVFESAVPQSAQLARLVVDLRGVEFFGTAGFSALHGLAARCAAERIEWALVPSMAVIRLLRLCDPDSSLPVQASLDAALGTKGSLPLFELIAKPR